MLNGAEGRIAFGFHARDIHLGLRSGEETGVPLRVLLDGAPSFPGASECVL